MSSRPSSSISNAFLVGILPLILLILITNILDRESLNFLVDKMLSFVPEDGDNIKPFQNAKSREKFNDRSFKVATTIKNNSKDKDNKEKPSNAVSKKSKSDSKSSKRSQDKKTYMIDQKINQLRYDHKEDVNDYYKALKLADALRNRDLVIHDGGSIQKEAIDTYKHAIKLLNTHREQLLSSSNDEGESIQYLLVSAYCSLGKQYYMANMFDLAVEAHNKALDIDGDNIDALNARASAQLILGKLDEAGHDYSRVLDLDRGQLLPDVFTGLAKVLVAKEDAISSGWDNVVSILNEYIPVQENLIKELFEDHSPKAIRERSIVVHKLVSHTIATKKTYYHSYCLVKACV